MPQVVACRTASAPDGTHEHIDLVGYRSPHIQYEPIMVSIPRLLAKAAADMEEFWVEVEGAKVPVQAGACSVCGAEPYLRTDKDPAGGNLLLQLPAG